ncbi:MAG: alpha/beta hydrolase [Pirellulaceae bacterium]|nr:alpha/beta hydrolase [Pirellulaceae bacterium]
MIRVAWAPVAMLVGLLTSTVLAAAEPEVLSLWPKDPPGESPMGPEAEMPARPGQKGNVIRLTNINRPTLTVYRPEKPNGAAVIICPGGGYSILAWDLEGTEVAEWLNKLGVTGIVLKYRVPAKEPRTAPQQDVQRAVALVRSKRDQWQLDPERIGVLGFSAGGNLAARACLQYSKRLYDAVDAADQASCRPDFGVLIYPAYLADDAGQLKPEFAPTSQAPPIFFAHAYDDGVKAENSIALFLALKQAKVPAELHVYSTGGHGFGLRPSEHPVSTWPDRCRDWLVRSGVLK